MKNKLETRSIVKKCRLLSALTLVTSLVACGGGSPETADGKPDSLLPPDFVLSSSSVASSTGSGASSSASPIVNTSLPIYESFSAIDIDNFLTANYKALSTNTELQFYYPTSGYPVSTIPSGIPRILLTDWTNNALWFGNARFTIGQTRLEADTTTADPSVPTWGELDLSRPYRISFCVKDTSASTSKKMMIFVDNNTSAQANSIHGNPNRIMYENTANLIPGSRFSIESSVGTSRSFLGFRVESATDVIIDDLIIEHIDTPYTGEIPTCVADSSFVRPVAASSSSLASSSPSSSSVSSASESSVVASESSASTSSQASESSSSASSATGGGSSASGAWTAAELNLVGESETQAQGSLSVNQAGSVTLTASGGNLSSSVHNTFFAYNQIAKSDFVFTARIASVTGATIASSNTYRFGLMVMANIDTAASYADLAAWADVGFYVNGTPALVGSRANMKADNSRTRSDIATLAVGNYVRIEVYDEGTLKRVRRLTSTDGINFTQANSTTDFKATSTTDNWFVGLYAAPGVNTLTVEFDNITIEDYLAPEI